MRKLAAGVWALGVAGLVGVGSVRAQEADPLSGPKVVEHTRPATLVKREMGGSLVPLDTRPEQAAIDLLGLSESERAAADKVLQERFAQVSKALSEHYDLFLKIATARKGGASREEQAPLLREFAAAERSLLDPPLADRVADMLPKAKVAQFRALVREYSDALMKEEASKRGNEQPVGERRAAMRAEIGLTLREMGRALKATVDDRRERTDELIQKLDVTPEQEARIRAIIREVAGKDAIKGELKEEKRREMMRKIFAELTPEQRKAAMERLRPQQP